MTRWQRVWVVIQADLRQLLRQRSVSVLMVVLVLSGVGLAVGSARIEPAALVPMSFDDADTDDTLEPMVLCDHTPTIAVDGVLPPYLAPLGTQVAADDPTARVGAHWIPGDDTDGELLYWLEPGGTNTDRERFVECARMLTEDERNRRLEHLGITFRRWEVLRLRRHNPPDAPSDFPLSMFRWTRADLPAGLDLFEAMAAFFAMLLASGQVADGILRNRTSGWEETLGISGLNGPERVATRMGATALLSLVSVALLALGGLLASPFVGLFIHPGRLLVATLTPLSVGVVLVTVTRGATDVRAATAQAVVPFALLMYAAIGAVGLDLVWMPFGGPLVLAIFGGTPLEWGVGVTTTVVPLLAVLGLAMRGIADVRTNHGERRTAAERHASGRFGPEVLLICALGFWSLAILPMVAGNNLVVAHLVGQVVGLGGVAVVAPRALGLPTRRTLGLVRPSARSLVAGALMPLGSVPMMLLLMHIQTRLGWVDAETLRALEQFGGQTLEPLAEGFGGVLLWAVPGTMEELLLRGAVLGLLLPRGPWKRTRGRTAFAVVAQAVAFGLLHMLAARWLPTGALGLVLGIFAVRSRSILPGMVAHMMHNFLAIHLLAHLPPTLLEDPWKLAALATLVVPVLWLAAPPATDGPQGSANR